METLVVKQKILEMQYAAIGKQIEEFRSKIATLDEQHCEIKSEIEAINVEMLNMSGALDDDTKYYLYQDLNKIEKLHMAYENDDNTFILELQYDATEPKYNIKMDCTVTKCKVTVTTSSENVCNIIRKSFTNNPYCTYDEEDSITKMHTVTWFSGPYGCCSKSFTYDKQMAKSLLCPLTDEEDRGYSNRGRRRR